MSGFLVVVWFAAAPFTGLVAVNFFVVFFTATFFTTLEAGATAFVGFFATFAGFVREEGRFVAIFFFAAPCLFSLTFFFFVVVTAVVERFFTIAGFLVVVVARFGFADSFFLGSVLETDLLEVFGITTSIQNEATNTYFIVHSLPLRVFLNSFH